MSDKIPYNVGVVVESKERYEHLMDTHSRVLCGLNFKELFDGYPEGYPCVVQYITDIVPFGFMMQSQLDGIVKDNYKIVIELEK